jgi:hypothetical protein
VTNALGFGRAMRPPKYPLEPLAALREKKVEGAIGELAAARRASDSAERDRLASEQKGRAHDAAAGRVRGAELEALCRGDLRVADLARADGWEARIAAERRALEGELERARASEAGARAEEGRAVERLASRRAEAQVVDDDRARWQEAARKRGEARDEQAASEASRPAGR